MRVRIETVDRYDGVAIYINDRLVFNDITITPYEFAQLLSEYGADIDLEPLRVIRTKKLDGGLVLLMPKEEYV